MKKSVLICIAIIAAILAVLALSWGMMFFSGEEVLLLDCLPQDEWLEFEGGCGNPTNPGNGMNLDDFREKYNVPDEVPYTTIENVCAALEGLTVRTGRAAAPKGDFFQYSFLLAPETDCDLKIYQNGCIMLHMNSTVIGEDHYVIRGSISTLYFHDNGAAYDALDARFLNLHEERALLGIPD